MKPGLLCLTLGCRSNQYESDSLAEALSAAGFEPLLDPGRAAVVIINTCTVTHRADKQSRQLIRRAVRQNPGAKIVVTGCLAALEGRALADMPGVDLVLDHAAQPRLAELLTQGASGLVSPPPQETFIEVGLPIRQRRSRALLKVQDGCDNACAFCRVRLARGRGRSLPLEKALAAARKLAAAGYAEVVLTGIHLGAYGRDLDPPLDLAALAAALLSANESFRLRLSSLEPGEVNLKLLDLAAKTNRLCPHFHLPLQSGDGGVLEAMNRSYRPSDYVAQVRLIKERLPQAAVGADVMVGFPGESEEAFENTLRLIESLPLAYLHVFPFSKRPGAPAAAMDHQVPQEIISRRAQRARALGQAKRLEFMTRFVGRTVKAVVEGRRDAQTGLLKGVSEHYLPLLLKGPPDLAGRLVAAVVEEVAGPRLLARTGG